MTRTAVVGHVEWVQFVSVDAFPARGAVTAARASFTHAGGGAVVAAAVLAELGVEVVFFSALGRDAPGDTAAAELEHRGVAIHAGRRETPTRGVVSFLEPGGERTIVTLGERLEPQGDDELPWAELAGVDGVYFTAGDAGAAARARAAPVLVSTPRARDGLLDSGVIIDALVFSGHDESEQRWARQLEPQTRLMVETEGGDGGRWWGESEGRWAPAPIPGELRDDYGCGDAFAAGVMLGLARGQGIAAAAGEGARLGAQMAVRTGAP